MAGWPCPIPTPLGRWLRRCGATLTPILDELVWHLVRIRLQWQRVPRAVTVVVDSTVILRYELKQAGAEVGYNPKKPGQRRRSGASSLTRAQPVRYTSHDSN